jgi:hypothetical protein
MRIANGMAGALLAALWLVAGLAAAYDGPVEKRVFSLPSYTTVGGKTIKGVKVGYETYGKLNAAGDFDDLHGEGQPALPAFRRRGEGHEGEDPVRAGGVR